MMQPEYESPAQAGKRWGVSRQRVMEFIADGRIPGVFALTDGSGRILTWQIPADAKSPAGEPGRPAKS